MFEPLFAWLSDFWEVATPAAVVNQTDKAVVYRWGKVQRVVEPGLRWMIPFAEVAEHTAMNTRFTTLNQQSLETKDGMQIVVCAVVQWRVNDIEAAQLKVEASDIEEAVVDASCGAIGAEVRSQNWETLRGPDYFAGLKDPVQGWLRRYGVLVEKVGLVDLTRSKTYRVFRD